jgi:hypothetical protein
VARRRTRAGARRGVTASCSQSAAFLAEFATFEYRWAFHPCLDLVQKQIIESDKELIEGAWWIAGPEFTEDPIAAASRA